MRLFLQTPPQAPLLTLAEAYQHLRLDPSFGVSPEGRPDDALILSVITAATQHLDGWTGVLGRALVSQVYRAEAACPDASRRLQIPMPVASVDTVEVLRDDAYELVSANEWTWRDMGSWAVVQPRRGFSWPSHDADEAAFRITFTAGYGGPEDVPAPIRQAALLLLGAFYENREADITGTMITALPHGVDMLIAPWRVRPNG